MGDEQKTLEAVREAVAKSIDARLPTALKEVVEPMIADRIASATEKAADLAAQRVATGKDITGLSSEKKMKFVEQVKNLVIGNQKSLIDGYTDAGGGVLLPVETAAGIMRLVESVGIVAAQATKIPMSGVEQIIVPRYTGSVLSGGYVGAGATRSSESVTFGDATLKKHTWMTIFRLGNSMFKNANTNVADFLMALVAEGLAYQMEEQVFNGVGAPFVGITQDSDVNVYDQGGSTTSGKETFAEVAYGDLVQLQTLVKPSALNSAAYFMHRKAWAIVKQLVNDAGQYLTAANTNLMQDAMNANPAIRPIGFIDGFPVYATEVLPSATAVSTKWIVFGSLKNVLLGDGGEMTVAKSDSATVDSVSVFTADQSALRFTHDHALAVALPSAFAVLKTAAS